MSDVGPEGRSFARLEREDLNRLADIAEADRAAYFAAHPGWAELYSDRVLAIALCQGAADHFVHGKSGINDLDVYTFYAAHPARHWYAKRNKTWDFGDPKFGQTIDKPEFVGRRVDLLGRGIPYRPSEDPAKAIVRWIRTDNGTSAQFLRRKAVVLLTPRMRLGEVIWDPKRRPPAA